MANVTKAETLRQKTYAVLRRRNLTADEVADILGESILAIRPRVSELKKARLVTDTGNRRTNDSGKPATVWTAR